MQEDQLYELNDLLSGWAREQGIECSHDTLDDAVHAVLGHLKQSLASEYDVSVSCTFNATSPEDAVTQMRDWLSEVVMTTSYHVENLANGEVSFIH